MTNQGGDNINRRTEYAFAELQIEGTRECPRCHVQFNPHLGNLLTEKFQCESCKAEISFRTSSGKAVKCPCCHFFRPVPKNLTILICGGCEAIVIYQRGDEVVKCCLCKHITNSADAGHVYLPPIRANPVVPSAQANQVVPPTQANQVVPPTRVNRVVHPTRVNQRKRRANAEETESTATSSFTPLPQSQPHTIVPECTDAADSVPKTVRNVALGIRTIKRGR